MGDYSVSYPFTAIVGQDDMKLALCLNAVNPTIGGVLISGERGTAKTTAVRALAGILGGSRVVELPLNATEDRVVGTLRVDELVKSGERVFEPGILADADGNILYVDEVNLLEDHIVDLLLDAAATGVCRIERDGISRECPARFVLVGTMNPEEGSLRPQLLDRFGLSVKVSGTLSHPERLELLKRQVDFESDPVAFCERYAGEQRALEQRIGEARNLYPNVVYSDDAAACAAAICDAVGVDGYRADIVIMRAARAAAALEGRVKATRDDVKLAAWFALPHRMKKLPFEEADLTVGMLEKAMEAQPVPDDTEISQDEGEQPDRAASGMGGEAMQTGALSGTSTETAAAPEPKKVRG